MSSFIKTWIILFAGLASSLPAYAKACRVAIARLEGHTLSLARDARLVHELAADCGEAKLASDFSALATRAAIMPKLWREEVRPILTPKLAPSVRQDLEALDASFRTMRFPTSTACGAILQMLSDDLFANFTQLATAAGQSITTTLMQCPPEQPFCNRRSFHGTPLEEESEAPVCGDFADD